MNPSTVLLIGECHEGALLPVTAELVTAGRAIEPERLILGLFGSGIGEAASAAAALGVDEVLVVDQAEMAPFSTGPATAAAAAMRTRSRRSSKAQLASLSPKLVGSAQIP